MWLTKYGRAQWLGSAMIALPVMVVAPCVGYPSAAIAAGLLWLAVAAFFRDPHRDIPADPGLLVSPADGKVTHVETIEQTPETELLQCDRALRISIFLSVLDVHVNRAPCDLTVEDVVRSEGLCLDARKPESAQRNTAATIVGRTASTRGAHLMLIRQITGAVARRIVCPVEPGQRLVRGEDYGMIKFGSRTEVYVPVDAGLAPLVAVGDRVQGGSTVIAHYAVHPAGAGA